MKLKKLLAAVTAAACSASMFLTSHITSTAEEAATIKIMSIGDSITDGYGTDGSYRKFLYNNLTEKGYKIDMVGSNWSWGDANYTDADTGESFTYDAAHCGYSGYAIKAYSTRSGILETIQSGNYLSEYTPDIVILQIGTNDVIDNHEIDTAGERLEDLADYILQNISNDSALFITTIPNLDPNRSDVYSWFGNYRHSADWQTNYSDEEVVVNVQKSIDDYNAQVKALVESKKASGVSNIYYGNVNSAVTDVTSQLKDGVHPNDVGYKLMGEYWTNQIDAYLSGNTETDPTEPQPTTEATEPSETVTTVATDATEPVTTTATDVTEPVTTTATDATEPVTTTATDVTEPVTTTSPIETQPATTTTSNSLYGLKKGDANLDGQVTRTDAVILSQFLSGKIYSYSLSEEHADVFDMNSDKKINVFDLIILKRTLIKFKA